MEKHFVLKNKIYEAIKLKHQLIAKIDEMEKELKQICPHSDITMVEDYYPGYSLDSAYTSRTPICIHCSAKVGYTKILRGGDYG
jgi:hypothetical protein